MSAGHQYIPFKLPNYLGCYLASHIGDKLETFENEPNIKVIPITGRKFLGKLILKSLIRANQPRHKTKTSNFYLKIKNTATSNYNGVPDLRSCFATIDDKNMNLLREHISELFKKELVSFVRGCQYAQFQNKGITKGIQHDAIKQFMIIYHIDFDDTTFSTLLKLYQRNKNLAHPLKTLVSKN